MAATNIAAKPPGVPSEAVWDEDENEWVVGQRNADGELIGIVQYYRPDGSLCCRTNFVDGTPHGAFQRFHENGEPSSGGQFNNGDRQGCHWWARSTAPTTENFPSGLGEAIWRCEMDFASGNVVEGRLFDRQGRRVMESGEPFPEVRPPGVPQDAHFRKPDNRSDYCWVSGVARVIDGTTEPVRLGVWRTWTTDGILISEEPYDDKGERHGLLVRYSDSGTLEESLRFEHGERVYERPSGVPANASFDEDDELWIATAPEIEGQAHGQLRCWDEQGRLRRIETYEQDQIVRLQEVLSDNTWGQDSTYIHGGVPQRRWLRRTDDEELDSFPNVCGQHPSAREVEYLFDAHGMMTGYTISDGDRQALEAETIYRNAANDTEQRRFASMKEASAAWIEAGDTYTRKINSWLAELYETGEPSEEEPTIDDDLERATIEAIESLNHNGQGLRVRELFPRYYDGIGRGFWHKYGLVLDRVLHAGDALYGRVIPPNGKPDVMGLKAGVISPATDVLAMGSSHDKRFLAWAFDAGIQVVSHAGTTTFAYPTSYGHAAADALGTDSLGKGEGMKVRDVLVLPSGNEIVLVCSEGIYLISQSRAQRLYPLDDDMNTYVDHFKQGGGQPGEFNLEMNFPNADISPDGTRVSCGGMFRRGNMAGLAIWHLQQGQATLKNTSQADAFFPMQATFHRELPHMAFAATLYASLSNHGFTNTTFRIDLDDLEDGPIEEFAGGIAQESGIVNVIASFGKGFLLGYDDGYVRWMGVEENAQLLGYVFVGGSIRDIDVSADQQGFVVASDSGLMVEFRLANAASRNLITTMPLEDRACAAFFRTFEPMLW